MRRAGAFKIGRKAILATAAFGVASIASASATSIEAPSAAAFPYGLPQRQHDLAL